METVTIIPARGGSKGIPGKNIRNFKGKPLLAWTIEAAKQAQTVNRILVSTDDQDIALVASRAGAEVIIRPSEISGDEASSETALLHGLEQLTSQGYIPDILVFLQCTSPLTRPEDIDGTVNKLISDNAETALAVAPFHYYVWSTDNSGEVVGINHDIGERLLRQQRSDQFVETGSVYVMRVEGFLKHKHRFFGKTVLHVTPSERCWEIDDPIDWVVGEAMKEFLDK